MLLTLNTINNLLLEYNQIREDMKKTKDELNRTKDDANKKLEIEQELSFKIAELLKFKDELEEKDNDLEKMKERNNKYKQEVKYLKNELIKKDDSKNKKRHHSKSKKRTDQAKSFKDQKGKGHVNLPIILSKIYTDNSSKELINDVEQLINNLYGNKQITKQVYNNLNKAITYKNDS